MNLKQVALSSVYGFIKITFPYNPKLVPSMHQLEGKSWNPKGKYWGGVLCVENIEMLLKLGFMLEREVHNWYVKQSALSSLDTIDVKGLNGELRPYQKEGVAFVEQKGGRALIADDMGIGKTLQAIAWTRVNPKINLPVIIVCPASVKYHWKDQLFKWVSDKLTVQVYEGKKNNFVKADYHIVNYDILYTTQKCPTCDGTKKIWKGRELVKCPSCKGKGKLILLREDLMWVKAVTIIFDEIHFIKDPKSNRSMAASYLVKSAKHVIGLSGTPIDNRPKEIYPGISLINPSVFPSWWKFMQRYCGAEKGPFGWKFDGASNIPELYQKLTSTVMIRRKKEDVLKDLPAKTKVVVPLPIGNKKAYQAAVNKFEAWLDKNPDNPAEAMVEMGHLKQAAVAGKIEACVQWIWDFLDSDEKLVVFCTHKATVAALKKRFGALSVVIDGTVALNKRKGIIDTFVTDPEKRLFIGNLKAVGTGVDGLQKVCSNSCTIEFGWIPTLHNQADDRLHRIGQDDAVTSWYLIGMDTIEEDIIKLLDKKSKILSQVLDGEEAESRDLLSDLLNKFN